MAGRKTESLFDRTEKREQAAQEHWGVLVPVDDFNLYCMLAREIAQAAATGGEKSHLVLLVDAATAEQIEAVDSARIVAERAFHFGDTIPRTWAVAPNTIPCEAKGEVSVDDRFLVALSSGLSLAVLGAKSGGGSAEDGAFRGGWTGQYGVVKRLAETVLASSGHAEDAMLPPPPAPEHAEQVYACSLRLMAQMTQQLSSRERDIARDKSDLSSVLDILKAISAKRRAHDILYVFVEQIARVVEMGRCSVVRVWGGESKGHVLASHEDPSIRDLVIDLAKYPELYHAMERRAKVVISDVLHEPLTNPFAEELSQSGITSLIVIPVLLFDQNIGSLFLRAARASGPFSLREISFCEIVAEAAANALERTYLFDSIQKANERLEFLAVTDGLTGLYNQRFFRERLEEEFERARRYSLPLSCLILDVDDFKRINDRYGHLAGDTVLREIAVRTSQMVRKSDILARYGGEEFVVILPQTELEGARAEAERIRREIGGRPYENLPEDEQITVSIGVTVFDQEAMLDCEALIRAADDRLYRAKRAGKNCVVSEKDT